MITDEDFKVHKIKIFYKNDDMDNGYIEEEIEINIVRIYKNNEIYIQQNLTEKSITDKENSIIVKPINNYGEITIDFSMKMLVPQNITNSTYN